VGLATSAKSGEGKTDQGRKAVLGFVLKQNSWQAGLKKWPRGQTDHQSLSGQKE